MIDADLQKIESLWNQFLSVPFPEDGVSFTFPNGRDFVELDTFAAGCITTFIGNAGNLDRQRHEVLKGCLKELSMETQILEDGSLKTRIDQLRDLSKMVLEYLDK